MSRPRRKKADQLHGYGICKASGLRCDREWRAPRLCGSLYIYIPLLDIVLVVFQRVATAINQCTLKCMCTISFTWLVCKVIFPMSLRVSDRDS